MQHLHHEIRVEAPVEHVWKLYSDASHWEDWQPRSTFSDFSGPVDEVGTTYVQTGKLLGFEMKSTFEIMEVEPQRLIHEHTDTGPQDNYLRLEPNGDATNLSVDVDYELPGRMPGFVKDLMSKGFVERNVNNMLADFKALAEAKVPAEA